MIEGSSKGENFKKKVMNSISSSNIENYLDTSIKSLDFYILYFALFI